MHGVTMKNILTDFAAGSLMSQKSTCQEMPCALFMFGVHEGYRPSVISPSSEIFATGETHIRK